MRIKNNNNKAIQQGFATVAVQQQEGAGAPCSHDSAGLLNDGQSAWHDCAGSMGSTEHGWGRVVSLWWSVIITLSQLSLFLSLFLNPHRKGSSAFATEKMAYPSTLVKTDVQKWKPLRTKISSCSGCLQICGKLNKRRQRAIWEKRVPFNTVVYLVLENMKNAIQSMRMRDFTHIWIPISHYGARK